MKKILKNAILGLALVPCMFSAVACGGDDDKDQGLSSEQKVSAYNSLRSYAVAGKLVDDTQSYAVERNTSEKFNITYDFTQSGLGAADIESAKTDGDMGNSAEYYMGTETIGYKTDGTGYRVEKEYEGETLPTSTDYVLEELSIVKKSEDKYVRYEYDYYGDYDSDLEVWTPEKTAAYVSAGHAKHEYAFEDGSMSELLTFLKDSESYDEFKADATEFATALMGEMADSVDVESATAGVDITKENNDYVLTISLNFDDFTIESMTADIACSYIINFDANGKISRVLMDMDMDNSMVFGKAMLEGLFENKTFTDDNKIVMNYDINMSQEYKFGVAFDNAVFNTNTTDYVGSGENGALKGLNVYQRFILVGLEDTRTEWVEYDTNINSSIEPSRLGLYDEGVSIELYWDEACTDKIEDTEKLTTSYDDKPIYVKVIIDDGYAMVSEIVVSETYTHNYFKRVHYVEDGNYEIYYIVCNPDNPIAKVEVNGVEVTNYEEGIALVEGSFNIIKIYS